MTLQPINKMAELVVVKNFVNGNFVNSADFIDSFDPSIGEPWAKIPNSNEEEVREAVMAAKTAFGGWSQLDVSKRSEILLKIADLLEGRLEEFVKVESRDQGKPLSVARVVDIPRAIYNFRHFATCILSDTDMSFTRQDQSTFYYTSREPVGVAGLISPWNLPLYLLTFKIAPALAYGNTIVAKPSEMTSVTAWMLCSIFNEAGVPPGVVNIVHGTGPMTGEAILKNPDISLLSFTGSTKVGKRIMEVSSNFLRKISLELGGKNPAIVCEDADLKKCVRGLATASFVNQGEVCLSSSRIYVDKKIYKPFLDAFIVETRKWTVGPPSDKDTRVGALISKQHMEKVKGYIDLARKEGATICCGEGIDTLNLPPDYKEGYYVLPTVITNISDNSKCMTEEIFGPVTCVVPFDTEDEAIKKANDTPYGLSATLWTTSINRSQRLSRLIKAGTVWVNSWMMRDLKVPFGGCKMSGIGREGSEGSRDFFTEQKTTCITYE